MNRIAHDNELDAFPTRLLEMPGGAVTEILVPESRKEEVLRQLYPFVGVPGLDDEMYDLHEDRPFKVRDYKVVVSDGVHFLVSPYFARSGGSVIDWIPMRRSRARSVEVRPARPRRTASVPVRAAGRQASADIGICLLSLAILASIVLAFCPAPSAVGGSGPEPERTPLTAMACMDLDSLRQLSKMGDAEASFELARRLEEGEGVPRDASAAGHMYLVAEEQGYDLPDAVIDRLHL